MKSRLIGNVWWRASRLAALLLAGAGLVAATAVRASDEPPAPASCENLMRELKLLSFDQEWQQVETTSRRLIALGPDCEHQMQASRLLAQALDRQGRSEEAFEGYGIFLETWCDGADSLVCDQARTEYFRLAAALYGESRRQRYLDPLLDGMDRSDDTGILAALTLADIDDARIRRLALPRLEEAHAGDLDREIKTRVCLAMLKIDPSITCGDRDDAASGPAAELLSVEVWDKQRNRPELRVNVPVALAEVLIRSLPEEVHAEMAREGVDVREIFQAIREQSSGTLFEAETADMKVRIWLQ